ncbi:MAG TPA: DUF1700 domain-containing protein [Candidatus Limnocylindria bacterium]|nr:DUF1700 domain-containing protein [Candidatus Limnocylindria bacterium]
MHEADPSAEYLRRFHDALHVLGVSDRDELVAEIESHLAEAERAGQAPWVVTARLGDPHRLARAFAASSLLADGGGSSALRSVRAATFLATTSLASMLLVPLLLVLALGFVISGAIGLFFGVAAFFLSPAAVSISTPTYEAAAASVALGIAFVGLAVLAARALRSYLRFAARTVRSAAMRLSADGA